MGVDLATSRRVLLVDDERENLAVLGALLDDDYEVELAASGREALAICERSPVFAAVISDQRMPGMTGVELLTHLAERSPSTVRMVLTAYSDIAPIVAAVNEGSVYRFFLKPWEPHEMRSAVADAVWLYEARTALHTMIDLLAHRREELDTTLATLKKSQNELLAAERMSTLGRFSAGITHNIRNSLTVMMNLLEIVQQNPSEQAMLLSAQKAFQSLDALLRLVNDVNALARGRLTSVGRAPVEMEPFLDKLVNDFTTEPLGQGHVVDITLHPSSRVLAFDPARMRQALLSLLRGAAQIAEPGAGVRLLVSQLAQGHVCFEARPRPQGLPMHLGHEPPTPPPSLAPQPDPAQLALGLEICRVVADAHGGRVAIQQRAGRPATVQLWIAHADPEGETA
jgi:CheY-like chemotaxis protein